MCDCTEGYACSGVWWATQLLVYPGKSVLLCVHLCDLPCMCLLELFVLTCPYASCCCRKSFELSLEKPLGMGFGRLWGMCKAVRWICVHHGWVLPQGHDSRSEQRVTTKEQQTQWRQSSTNPLLKWSSDRDVEGWGGELCGIYKLFGSCHILYLYLMSYR